MRMRHGRGHGMRVACVATDMDRRGYDISVSHRLNAGATEWQLFHML